MNFLLFNIAVMIVVYNIEYALKKQLIINMYYDE